MKAFLSTLPWLVLTAVLGGAFLFVEHRGYERGKSEVTLAQKNAQEGSEKEMNNAEIQIRSQTRRLSDADLDRILSYWLPPDDQKR